LRGFWGQVTPNRIDLALVAHSGGRFSGDSVLATSMQRYRRLQHEEMKSVRKMVGAIKSQQDLESVIAQLRQRATQVREQNRVPHLRKEGAEGPPLNAIDALSSMKALPGGFSGQGEQALKGYLQVLDANIEGQRLQLGDQR
jgi:hypothetical protein